MPPLLMDGTFTVPYITYDAYGRVTGRTNRTITLPAAPTSVSSATTATTATAIPNIMLHNGNGGYNGSYNSGTKKYTIPSGGTWAYILFNPDISGGKRVFTVSGGSTVNATIDGDFFDIMAFRVS